MEARILERDELRVTQDRAEIQRALESKLPVWIDIQKKDEACDQPTQSHVAQAS